MQLPFVIDNQTHRLADALNELLSQCRGKPFDAATAYFSISGYKLVRDHLHHVGAFRLLIGSDPQTGADIGLKPDNQKAIRERLRGDLEAEPFTEETLRLVENLIAFLRADKVEVRLYSQGFLHAKAYLFHQDAVTPSTLADRLRPFAAIVGSSNFTAPGLMTNKELNIVHRVFMHDESPADWDAARSLEYLRHDAHAPQETILDPSGEAITPTSRLLIKSEVGARAISDLMAWYEKSWTDSHDFKNELIELLDSSKFGEKEYTPYQVYMKALYEYFREELGEDAAALGRSAVDLAEFQEDAYKKAKRILTRYDGVLIADSVGLGKTWIGKRLLEDFAYHRRQKAVVVCPASLREMWRKELNDATISAKVVGMEELGRESFDMSNIGDADVLLVDESHNFRNNKANRYLALDQAIQMRGGRGRDGERKKVILLSATPINNDLFDLANQVKLFSQSEPDYFREAGIGDVNAYFKRARRLVRQENLSAGEVLFNLLEEIMVRNTRPFIRAAYPNATIKGEKVAFPERRLKTIQYDLGATYGGLYEQIAHDIELLTLAPYQLETYRKKEAIKDEQEHEWEAGRGQALVGIFKTRFLKRLESSIAAFRLSLKRALVFEDTYRDYLLDGRALTSSDFQKAVQFLSRDEEDDIEAASLADKIDEVEEAKNYLANLPKVNLNDFNLRKLSSDVEHDVKLLRTLYERTEPLAKEDGKLEQLKDLLADKLKGKKVLVFTSFRDTARYVLAGLTDDAAKGWRKSAGNPEIYCIDSSRSPAERESIIARFAPQANNKDTPPDDQIDVLISTDVLSEGQNLQDCGVCLNYDLTWNPIRLVQRNGRIDRLRSPHKEIQIFNMFPEKELESLLKLVERLTDRISVIDDLGLLDASVLGEVVHPRTFNVLRRIRDEDGAVLNEEEARAELAGPELLLKELKEMLNKKGTDAVLDLPNGIHSGLRRDKHNGMFFYFQAPRPSGEGKRHFWRYIDANSGEIAGNRYEIARLISCSPDEPRYIEKQDVFALQEKVIENILSEDKEAEARAAVPTAVDPIQQTVTEELKDIIRRGKADRTQAKNAISFLGQPMGKYLVVKLRSAYSAWEKTRSDVTLVSEISSLAVEFTKQRSKSESGQALKRDDLELVCFEYVTE